MGAHSENPKSISRTHNFPSLELVTPEKTCDLMIFLSQTYLYACPKLGYARNRSRATCFNEGFLKQAILGSKRLAENPVGNTDEHSQKSGKILQAVCATKTLLRWTRRLYDDQGFLRPDLLPDYTGLGSKLGSEGNTSHLYTKQVKLIKTISPDVAIIE